MPHRLPILSLALGFCFVSPTIYCKKEAIKYTRYRPAHLFFPYCANKMIHFNEMLFQYGISWYRLFNISKLYAPLLVLHVLTISNDRWGNTKILWNTVEMTLRQLPYDQQFSKQKDFHNQTIRNRQSLQIPRKSTYFSLPYCSNIILHIYLLFSTQIHRYFIHHRIYTWDG